jgi:hypothetical protein
MDNSNSVAAPLLSSDSETNVAPARHSQYGLTRNELTKAVANRFVHSRVYVALYLAMAVLSATTVALSLSDGCPGTAFYVLEIVVNSAMIAEVGIRFLAFGRVSLVSYRHTLGSHECSVRSNSGNHRLTYSI